MIVLALAIWSGAALAVQQRAPPSPEPDVVVSAGVPQPAAGLWVFHASAASGRAATGRPIGQEPRDWSVCARDGDTPALVEHLIGERASFDGARLCSRMSLRMSGDRVTGTRRCLIPSQGATSAFVAATGMRARTEPQRLTADYTVSSGPLGGDTSTSRWRVSAERIGDCRSPGRSPDPAIEGPASPAPLPSPSPLPTIMPRDAPTPAAGLSPERPARFDPRTGEEATAPLPPSHPATAARADDILVVSRKLRRLRLHYDRDGKMLRWCHADVSSGDPRLDRIGCALVRACVRDGFDDLAAVRVCVNRRIDMLDPAAAPRPASQR